MPLRLATVCCTRTGELPHPFTDGRGHEQASVREGGGGKAVVQFYQDIASHMQQTAQIYQERFVEPCPPS